MKKEVSHDNPYQFVKEHILKGDKSDGIPNYLSSDDTFVSGVRQKPISKKNLDKWVEQDPSVFCSDSTLQKNYYRNKQLIDFDCVPIEIEEKIMEEYTSLNNFEKKVPLEYFRDHQLCDLMEAYYFRNKITF